MAYGIPRALPSLLAWKQVHHHTVSRQHLCTWLSGREIAACKPEMGVSDWYANWCWYLIWRRAACEWTATRSVTENKIEMIGADSSSLGSRPLMRESRRSPKAKSQKPNARDRLHVTRRRLCVREAGAPRSWAGERSRLSESRY